MKLKFRTLAVLFAFMFISLAVVWMFASNIALATWGVEFSYPVGLVGRRCAALFAGIGVMLFSARNAEPSPARSALVNGLVVACLMLATLGVFELVTGHAGPGILPSVVVEVALALSLSARKRS